MSDLYSAASSMGKVLLLLARPQHQFEIPTCRVTARKIGELLPMTQTQNSLSVDVKALRRVARYQVRFAFGIVHLPQNTTTW